MLLLIADLVQAAEPLQLALAKDIRQHLRLADKHCPITEVQTSRQMKREPNAARCLAQYRWLADRYAVLAKQYAQNDVRFATHWKRYQHYLQSTKRLVKLLCEQKPDQSARELSTETRGRCRETKRWLEAKRP